MLAEGRLDLAQKDLCRRSPSLARIDKLVCIAVPSTLHHNNVNLSSRDIFVRCGLLIHTIEEGASDALVMAEFSLKFESKKEVFFRDIVQGETALGRNDFDIEDKRCSKRQLLFTRNGDKLTVTRVGVNPSRLLRGDEDIMLDKDVSQRVQDGDYVEIVVTMYPLYVTMAKSESKLEPDDEDKTESMDEGTCDWQVRCFRLTN